MAVGRENAARVAELIRESLGRGLAEFTGVRNDDDARQRLAHVIEDLLSRIAAQETSTSRPDVRVEATDDRGGFCITLEDLSPEMRRRLVEAGVVPGDTPEYIKIEFELE